jgi:hypothetical protein
MCCTQQASAPLQAGKGNRHAAQLGLRRNDLKFQLYRRRSFGVPPACGAATSMLDRPTCSHARSSVPWQLSAIQHCIHCTSLAPRSTPAWPVGHSGQANHCHGHQLQHLSGGWKGLEGAAPPRWHPCRRSCVRTCVLQVHVQRDRVSCMISCNTYTVAPCSSAPSESRVRRALPRVSRRPTSNFAPNRKASLADETVCARRY